MFSVDDTIPILSTVNLVSLNLFLSFEFPDNLQI